MSLRCSPRFYFSRISFGEGGEKPSAHPVDADSGCYEKRTALPRRQGGSGRAKSRPEPSKGPRTGIQRGWARVRIS